MKNNYTRIARVYSTIAVLLIPTGISFFVFRHMGWTNVRNTEFVSFMLNIVPAVLLNACLCYFLMDLFRSTSKMIFQFPFFSEDETDMPTTNLLSWGYMHRMSDSQITKIAKEVRKRFGITLMSAEEETANMLEAKRRIVDAVGKIREETRENENVMRYNIQYGFCRNYLGGSVYALLMIIVSIIVNYNVQFMNNVSLWVFLGLQIILDIICVVSLKYRGNAYARALFNAFLTKK